MSLHRVRPGDVLGGKYEVERVLGAGGMGVVVLARHIDLGQRVALKFMLKDGIGDPTHAERFLREAKASVQLKSIHTARVLDVGRLADGEPYMVMEYLEGRDLDAELRNHGRLPLHVAVDYVLQASEALAEAHALGMIHRDVKLKNLFLTQTVDGRPLVKVLDFGLAKTLGPGKDVSLTATNSVFGSPQYMSPEQMRSAKDVDGRSDIWSMGVCLFELLTGRVPFDAGGLAEICAMVLKDPVPRPSTFVGGLPSDLEAVILRCLEKEPQHRFQSFGELAVALQPYAIDQGSARRILHVMGAVRKPSASQPTVFADYAHAATVDAGPKTINAWDSGLPNTRRVRLSRIQWLVGLTVSVCLAVIGIIAIVTVSARGTRSVTASASSFPESVTAVPGAALADPPPHVAPTSASTLPSPVGTVIEARPAAELGQPRAADGEGSAAEAAPAPAAPAKTATRAVRSPAAATHAASPRNEGVAPQTKPLPTPAASASKPPTKPKGPGSGGEYM
jgi:serine/threonine-protein kinase